MGAFNAPSRLRNRSSACFSRNPAQCSGETWTGDRSVPPARFLAVRNVHQRATSSLLGEMDLERLNRALITLPRM